MALSFTLSESSAVKVRRAHPVSERPEVEGMHVTRVVFMRKVSHVTPRVHLHLYNLHRLTALQGLFEHLVFVTAVVVAGGVAKVDHCRSSCGDISKYCCSRVGCRRAGIGYGRGGGVRSRGRAVHSRLHITRSGVLRMVVPLLCCSNQRGKWSS